MEEYPLTMKMASCGVIALLSQFVIDVINAMAVWLIVMMSVIILDLVASLRKHAIMHDEEIHFSKGMRNTIGKIVLYFAWVVCASVLGVAYDNLDIVRMSVTFVIIIEGCSIINNILKPKGLSINLAKILLAWLVKVLKADKEMLSDCIEKDTNTTRQQQ